MKISKKVCFTAGFALFSMFFGSGNLVFPLFLGKEASLSYPFATLGLISTAVIIPIIGFLGMILYDGDRKEYFAPLGNKITFLLTTLMLSLMGPFGAIPRCISVGFGGINLLFPSVDIWIFSLIFCISMAFLTWQNNNVVSIIGILLTPLKLGGISLLIIIGIYFAEPIQYSSQNMLMNIKIGAEQGYQTMDLLAGFFFGCTIIEFLKKNYPSTNSSSVDKQIFLSGIFAGLIGAILLAIVYAGFVSLGAHYEAHTCGIKPECLLAHISGLAIGKYAPHFVSFTLAISCLATATILVKLFADFFKSEILNDKITYHQSIILTLIFSFIGSLFSFSSIVSWLAFFLSWLYPFLLVYAIYRIYTGLQKLNTAKNLNRV